MKSLSCSLSQVVLLLSALSSVQGAAIPLGKRTTICRRTKVAILGAGIAGITTAQALYNQSITDFIIVEYQSDIGGRVHNAEFGKDPESGKPFLVEYGANWAQGLGHEGGPENPIWTFNVSNTPSDFDKFLTFNETGPFDFLEELATFEKVLDELAAEGWEILTDNLQDGTVREGLGLVGWKPEQRPNPAAAEAVEWFVWDMRFNDENNFVIDQRGHNTWIKGEASIFLKENDDRLILNTAVTNISYSDEGVIVLNNDGSCIEAEHAVVTFSVGVLQHDIVTFDPPLPPWKQTAIEMFSMVTYTKIFMQFEENFWGNDTQFFLYADPIQRGWYPIWQSLDTEGFFPGSSILFVTVVNRESYRAEKQSDEKTQEEVMEVLRSMFPDIDVPDPIAFQYPRWSQEPWAFGSFSKWPPGTTLEMHQNLRANTGRLWFAGEYTSSSYFGYMQGAWFEGRDVGGRLAGLLGATCTNEGPGEGECGEHTHYDVIHGTTELEEYDAENGWAGVSTDLEEEPLST